MTTDGEHLHPKVALVYDRVNTPYGGAEHVLVALHQLYPEAPLFTSVYDSNRAKWAAPFTVISSFLQRVPLFRRFHRPLVFLMPLAFETLRLQAFDIVISISSAEAKGVLTSPDQLHICYLLTPTRYLWSHQSEYEQDLLTGWIRKPVFKYLKWWDQVAAFRPDVIVPISKLVQERTEQFYHRQTLPVIYPPVSLPEKSQKTPELNLESPYFLIVSRLVSYKRIDIAIKACLRLHKRLVIIGEGPDKGRLQEMSLNQTDVITFLSAVQPDQITAYYQHCQAFLAPAEEDFGIATIEALQAGKPAIVYFKSGAAELIKNKKTGIYLMEQTVDSLELAISELADIEWNEKEIQMSVAGQSAVQFQSQFKNMVTQQWRLFEKGHYE